MSDRLVTQRELEGVLRKLDKQGTRLGRTEVIERPLRSPPYTQRLLNPFAIGSSGLPQGEFPQSNPMTIMAFYVSVFVLTTNNATNFWTIILRSTAPTTLAQVDTSALAINTWVRLSDLTITQPLSTNVVLSVVATATLTPGSIFMVPEILVTP